MIIFTLKKKKKKNYSDFYLRVPVVQCAPLAVGHGHQRIAQRAQQPRAKAARRGVGGGVVAGTVDLEHDGRVGESDVNSKAERPDERLELAP
jgi:hypothetical protein